MTEKELQKLDDQVDAEIHAELKYIYDEYKRELKRKKRLKSFYKKPSYRTFKPNKKNWRVTRNQNIYKRPFYRKDYNKYTWAKPRKVMPKYFKKKQNIKNEFLKYY